MIDMTSITALWGAVIVSGIFHGVNPGMGWPLAVSAALMERKRMAMVKAIGMLGFGHFLAMLAILLPFSMMAFLIERETEIRIVSGLIVIGMGLYLIVSGHRHPRMLSRVPPSRLALWSFLAAMAHGAGLMLLPIYMEMGVADAAHGDSMMASGHAAAGALMGSGVMVALTVSAVHTLAMTLSGALLAVAIYFWLGLKFISRTWFNLDLVWAISLILVGAFGVWSALHGGHAMHH